MNVYNKKILIIEDEKVLQNLLKEKMLAEGFTVFIAGDGLEGLNLALKEHPDLILLDLLLPIMDGQEFLEKLREDKWGTIANVTVLTNLSHTGDVLNVDANLHYKPEGVDEYIIKTNSSFDNLVQRIKEKLGVV